MYYAIEEQHFEEEANTEDQFQLNKHDLEEQANTKDQF